MKFYYDIPKSKMNMLGVKQIKSHLFWMQENILNSPAYEKVFVTVKVRNSKKPVRTIGNYRSDTKLIRIALDEKGNLFYSAASDLEEQKATKEFNWHTCVSQFSTLTHELGHAISIQLLRTNEHDKQVKYILSSYLSNVTDIKFNDLFRLEDREFLKRYISRELGKYASSSYHEAWAELFALAVSPKNKVLKSDKHKKAAFKAVKYFEKIIIDKQKDRR